MTFESYNALKPFKFLAGTPFKQPYDLIVDDYYARSDGGHHVGDIVTPMNKIPFRICGIVEHGKGGRKFMQIQTLGQLMAGTPNNASMFYLKSDDPKNEELIRKEILATPGLSQYQVQTLDEWLSLMTPSHLPAFRPALICGDQYRGHRRIHRDFPVHVYRHHGAHARDRHFEIAGGEQAVYRRCGIARDGAPGGGTGAHCWGSG